MSEARELALDEVEPSCYVRNFPRYARDQLCGTVYFIACQNKYVKIGFSADVESRLSELQVGCPFDLTVIGRLPNVAEVYERWFHAVLRRERVRGEWFNLTDPVRLLVHEVCNGARPEDVLDLHRLFSGCRKKGEGE